LVKTKSVRNIVTIEVIKGFLAFLQFRIGKKPESIGESYRDEL
jgi:hypothetical protein